MPNASASDGSGVIARVRSMGSALRSSSSAAQCDVESQTNVVVALSTLGACIITCGCMHESLGCDWQGTDGTVLEPLSPRASTNSCGSNEYGMWKPLESMRLHPETSRAAASTADLRIFKTSKLS